MSEISVVHPSDLGPREIAAWRAMCAATLPYGNPFLSFEFASAVGSARRDARVAVVEDSSGVVAFFPFQRRPLGIGKPIGHLINDCQGVIHTPEYSWDPKALVKACDLSVWTFDNLLQVQQPFKPWFSTVDRSPHIDVSRGFDHVVASAGGAGSGRGIYREAQRKRAKLSKLVGPVRVERSPGLSEEFNGLVRWKSAQYARTGQWDRFGTRWVREVVEHLLCSEDPIHATVSALYAGDAMIAAHLTLASPRIIVFWFPAYDPAYAKYSPGIILQTDNIDHATTGDWKLIELGKGQTEYKDRLSTGASEVAVGAVTTRSLRRLAWQTQSRLRRTLHS